MNRCSILNHGRCSGSACNQRCLLRTQPIRRDRPRAGSARRQPDAAPRTTSRPVRRLRRDLRPTTDGLRPPRSVGEGIGLTTPTALGSSRDRLILEVAKCDVICAVCHRIRTRVQHQRRLRERPSSGSSKYLERRRRLWNWHAQVLDELRQVPCADCGERFPPCAMDFDHREGSAKRVGVTRMVGRAGIKRILAEAAKCDIVCANCHRARTFRRRTSVSRAGVAQLVERRPSKPNVAGSNPVSRSNFLVSG